MLKKIITAPYRLIIRLYGMIYRSKIGTIGKRCYIEPGVQVDGGNNITLGNRVLVGRGTWLASVAHTGNHTPKLIFNDDCSIGHYNHIYCTKKIVFEKGVLTADRVYISDNLHSYEDINKFIKDQPIKQLEEVIIGEGSWIGENVCIMGAKIGKHCVVGANSVVTHDVPDYSVVVGSPAKVIKQYDESEGMYKTLNNNKLRSGGVISHAA